jgi:endonuclease YncB( thermonuclease family)
MLLGGLFLGLIVSRVEWAAAPAPIAPPVPTAIEAPSLYSEAERSREILEAQEGAPRPRLPTRIDGSHRASASEVRVIDGDTIDFEGMRVRLADIDTPEVRGRCAHETELAARATRRLRALLADGAIELHRLPSGRDEDRYGRKLRIVTRDGRSVGDMLVAEGLARTWTGRREPWCV